MNTNKPIKPEEGKIIQEATLEAQLQGHYWDELRKLKRVKIVMDANFSGIVFSNRLNEEDYK